MSRSMADCLLLGLAKTALRPTCVLWLLAIKPQLTVVDLVLSSISQKWTMPIRDWKAALTRFTIQFEERIPQG